MSLIIRSNRDEVSSADIDRLVRRLQGNGLIVAAADTVYGLVSIAFQPEAFQLLDSIKGNRSHPYSVVFSSKLQFLNWYGEIDPFRMRIIESLFPGPISLVMSCPENLQNEFRYGDTGISIRVSSNYLYRELAKRIESPLWATSSNRSGEPPPHQFNSIAPPIFSQVEIAVDTGPTLYKQASTVIDLREFPFRIVRQGPWADRVSRAISLSFQPLKVLTVCTGNICRSPILAEIIRHQTEDVPVIVDSAGTHAGIGNPATSDMIQIAAESGMNLKNHRSRPVSADDMDEFDIILVAEPEHKQNLEYRFPFAKRKFIVASEIADSKSIPDPYGGSTSRYNRVAQLIAEVGSLWADKLRDTVQHSGWEITQATNSANETDLPEEEAASPNSGQIDPC